MDRWLLVLGVVFFLAVGVVLANSGLVNNIFLVHLSPAELQAKIISQRDYAIEKAQEDGSYRCCIEPACRMCYMEANEWNNHRAGTCACDDLIAQGREACPQCNRHLAEGSGAVCSFNLEDEN